MKFTTTRICYRKWWRLGTVITKPQFVFFASFVIRFMLLFPSSVHCNSANLRIRLCICILAARNPQPWLIFVVVIVLPFFLYFFLLLLNCLRQTLYFHESHVSGNVFSKCFVFSLNLLFQECLSYKKRPCHEWSVCRAVENAEWLQYSRRMISNTNFLVRLTDYAFRD